MEKHQSIQFKDASITSIEAVADEDFDIDLSDFGIEIDSPETKSTNNNKKVEEDNWILRLMK